MMTAVLRQDSLMSDHLIYRSQKEFEDIAKKINKSKGNGCDYTPLTILNSNHGKNLISSTTNDLFRQEIPTNRAFFTRLMLLSKSSSNYPKLNEIRPIAITTIMQQFLNTSY